MTKTDLIFPAFSLRFLDFEVQFCFRSKLSFHEKPCFNRPISRAPIGSFLSSTRVQTDKIYANKLLVRVRLAFQKLFLSRHLTRFGSCYCQKFAAEPLACVSWFHSHFDNVMTQFIVNKRTDALKTYVNLLICVKFDSGVIFLDQSQFLVMHSNQ